MRSSHAAVHVSALFDEPNLIADAGLPPLVALAERAGLPELAAGVRIEGADNSGGAHAAAKVMSLLGAMCAGADSIDDADRLRHGAMARAFTGIRAPSTPGTFPRPFTHGHNQQLNRVHREFLASPARHTPLLPGAGELMFIDIDPTHRRVHGYAKQGAEHGRLKGQRTLHPIVATLSTPLARPVIGAVRLRRGKAADVRGAKSFVAQALTIARESGGTGIRMVRADSKFYTADVAAACRTAGAHFSLTTGMNPSNATAIGRIDDDAWTPIRYPDAFVDPDTGEMISDAEVAEIEYTTFTGRRKNEQVTARLIVRKVRRLNPHTPSGQGELFDSWRYHPIFADSPFGMLEAELHHRQHAIVEQAIADGKSSAPAHLPSGHFQANAAWLTLWTMSHNLLRAAGSLTSVFHAKATTATLRAHLAHVPARLARTARIKLTAHLPVNWPRRDAYQGLFVAVHRPPALG
ncbi:IS1380 family transposase [Streptomyces sp. KMM 9044]|uniref:IS1380 family transposase n=1 Tax=Streptomyces sp. KMM 9044 TaxID=2744474 RepID=UPI0021517B62|nr:IS1380 family transposase [Streptomyces sp. KMM 9044]WAX81232.1 IS1380 family transposase [Streptomyces sp. KMM 9044]